MRIPYRAVIVTDEMRRRALEVLETGRSYGGEDTQRFEVELAQRCGCRYGVATNSGTSLLLMALDALGVQAGDEVIMAANAYVGVLAPVVKRGAVPVLVEADPETRNIAPDAAAAAITARTRALVPVHMYGFPCDMEPLVAAARAAGVAVLEDAAHALGAAYRGGPVGSFGALAFMSFSGKMITVFGPGGAGVTNDRRLAEDLSSLCGQGRKRKEDVSFVRRTDTAWSRGTIPSESASREGSSCKALLSTAASWRA
jgi:perosamine synthetase